MTIYKDEINQSEAETSDEEDVINTVGAVPLKWYKNYDHIGYDVQGNSVKQLQKSNIDELIEKVGNPRAWRTISDVYNGKEIEIDVDTLIAAKKIFSNHLAKNDLLKKITISSDKMIINDEELKAKQELTEIRSKRSLNSNSSFAQRIMKNWMKFKLEENQEKINNNKKKKNKFYDIWSLDMKLPSYVKRRKLLAPPPVFLPGNCESYNPPEEYLLSEKEKEQWNKSYSTIRAAYSCIPQKSDSLLMAKINQDDYMSFVSDRCYNLYACPRISVKRLPKNLKSEDLLPKLEMPKLVNSLQIKEKIKFIGHKSSIIGISLHPNRVFMASICEAGSIRIWNIHTAKCLRVIEVEKGSKLSDIAWIPLKNTTIIVYSYDNKVIIQSLHLSASDLIEENNRKYFEKLPTNDNNSDENNEQNHSNLIWNEESYEKTDLVQNKEYLIRIDHPEAIRKINLHKKANYLGIVYDKPRNNAAICVHNIKKRKSQVPFKKLKGNIINAFFHPNKPIFFIVSQKTIKSYDLSEMKSNLSIEIPKCEATCASLHNSGNHMLIGSNIGKVFWFDLELTIKPLKILNCHSKLVKDVKFHQNFDIFASCSEDGTSIIYEGKVFDDIMKNPEIMPVKKIHGHSKTLKEPGVTSIAFIPDLKSLISGGHDKIIRLFV